MKGKSGKYMLDSNSGSEKVKGQSLEHQHTTGPVRPQPFLFHSKELYGRQREQRLLLQAFQRVGNTAIPSSEIVLVHGNAGAGKSVLVQSIDALLLADARHNNDLLGRSSHVFAMGKYDRQGTADPYSAISTVLSDLVKSITSHNVHRLASIRAAILEAVDADDLPILAALIPNLNRLVCCAQRNSGHSGRSNQEKASSKLRAAVCSFVRSLIAATHPTVIVLDDLQFASDLSISLIKALATDASISGMLLVLTYRTEEGEIKKHSSLAQFIDTMLLHDESPTEDQLCRHPVCEVEVGNLKLNDIDQLVRGITKIQDDEISLSLCRIIVQKTQGDAFHVVQFLAMLKSRHLLWYEHGRYIFDIARIRQETNVSENVASLVTARIQMLPSMTQKVLTTAACLRFSFAVEPFLGLAVRALNFYPPMQMEVIDQQGTDSVETKVKQALMTGIAEGLLEVVDETHVKFSHDGVQQALLALLPDEMKPHLHLVIGKYLLESETDTESVTEGSLFSAMDHFSRAREIITTVEDVTDLCRVSLLVAKHAVAQCDFAYAAELLNVAVAMASKTDLWSCQYELCLDVFGSSVEYESYAGRWERSYSMIDVILGRATNFEDMLRAYYAKLEGLAAELKLADAVDLGLMLLEKLGERMPRKPTTSQNLRMILKVSWLRSRPKFNFKAMEEMRDWKKIAAMRVLSLLSGIAWYLGDGDFFVAVTLKSMILSLQWGLSPFTSATLTAYASILGCLRNPSDSYQIGQLALELHQERCSKEEESFMFVFLATFINHSREPLRSQILLTNRAFESACDCGQHSTAMIAVVVRLQISFLAGNSLSTMQGDCEFLLNSTSNNLVRTSCLPFIQLIASLQDVTCNPYNVSGTIMDDITFAVECEASGNNRALVLLCTYQIAQAFLFQNWSTGVEVHEHLNSKYRQLLRGSNSHFLRFAREMWAGTAYLAMARFRPGYIRKARKIMREVGRYAALGSPDGVVYMTMLEAEYSMLMGTPSEVRDAFEAAMTACRKGGFVHYEAHLSERLGVIMLELGHLEKAQHYLSKAASLFKTWSSRVKSRKAARLVKSLKNNPEMSMSKR
jgi:histidine kinase